MAFFPSLALRLSDKSSLLLVRNGTKQCLREGFRQTMVGAYLQDDWRWRQNVTIIWDCAMNGDRTDRIHGNLTFSGNLTMLRPHLGDPLFPTPQPGTLNLV